MNITLNLSDAVMRFVVRDALRDYADAQKRRAKSCREEPIAADWKQYAQGCEIRAQIALEVVDAIDHQLRVIAESGGFKP